MSIWLFFLDPDVHLIETSRPRHPSVFYLQDQDLHLAYLQDPDYVKICLSRLYHQEAYMFIRLYHIEADMFNRLYHQEADMLIRLYHIEADMFIRLHHLEADMFIRVYHLEADMFIKTVASGG